MDTGSESMIAAAHVTPATPVRQIARFTIEQYDRMIAAGIFENGLQGSRCELIHGEIRPMLPIGPVHEDMVDYLTRWSTKHTDEGQVRVRIQQSIGLPGASSAPQPDIAWVRQMSYRDSRPLSDNALLVIEVADTSIDYDTGEKADLYAAAGISDYWVVDVQNQSIEIRRDPANGRYRTLQTFARGDVVRPLLFPDIELPVDMLFLGEGEKQG